LGAASAAGQEAPPVIGQMIVQTIPARHFVFGGIETDFQRMVTPVVQTLTDLAARGVEQKVGLRGPVVHYFYGAPHRMPDQPFKMETGHFVPAGTPAVGEFPVRELPEFKCATLLYVGRGAQIGDAWQALYRAVRAAGLTPTEEERELYLYFEGTDSPNNVVQVQVGVE
jgi:effector-binding domain-containing protein